MKMKWCAVALAVLLMISGCQKETVEPPVDQPQQEVMSTYTHLKDEESRTLLKELMDQAGISRESQEDLFEHIDQINEVMTEEQLTSGFENRPVLKPRYDSYDLTDQWNEKYPEFIGYCCRITAFTLFHDFITIDENIPVDENAVMMDMMALETDPGVFDSQLREYQGFYSPVPTTMTQDINTHVQTLQKAWKDRGISFAENEHASLISVIFHNDIDDPSVLETGHTGILFDDGEQLYFLEKLAFQEPYQLIKIKDRAELEQIMMARYDVSYNQQTASPFIMENDQLMK